MAVEQLSNSLLRAIARGIVGAAIEACVPGAGAVARNVVISVGEAVVERAFDRLRFDGLLAGFSLFRQWRPAEQQEALDGLAAMTPAAAAEACRTVLAESDAAVTPEAADLLTRYVAAVPHAVRRATTRFDDGGVTQTRLGQLPRDEQAFGALLPERLPHFKPGDRVPGRDVVLERLLGQGGFGEVWKGVDEFTTQAAAFKFCLDAGLKASLKREIQLLNAVREAGGHPNILTLRSTSYRNDPPFVEYEHIDGGDLGAWIAAFDGPPPADAVKAVLRQVALALAFAHERRIVHRDIKPANILVRPDGTAVVADFGIGALTLDAGTAVAEQHTRGMTALAGAHSLVYADPHRVVGQPDPREDVWAFGVVAVQLLLGDTRRASIADYRDELERQGVDDRLITVLRGCLRSPDRRLADGRALIAEMDRLMPGSSPAEQSRHQETRHQENRERPPPATRSGLKDTVARLGKYLETAQNGRLQGPWARPRNGTQSPDFETAMARQTEAARELVSKGLHHLQLGQSALESTLLGQVAGLFGSAAELPLRRQQARALVNKGYRLGQLGRTAEELAAYDEAIGRFGEEADTAICEQVAKALVHKGFRLGQLGRSEEELAAYDDAVRRFGRLADESVGEAIGMALFNKAVRLDQLGRGEEAAVIQGELADRLRWAERPFLRELGARALVGKGHLQARLGLNEAAAATYGEALMRYGNAREAGIRQELAEARQAMAALSRA